MYIAIGTQSFAVKCNTLKNGTQFVDMGMHLIHWNESVQFSNFPSH